MTQLINIEVAFATPDKQIIVNMTIPENTSVIDAIHKSNIKEYFPDNPILENITNLSPIGIFGKKIDVDSYKLRNKDRIEIYRPLNKTPNQKRLERAKKK